MPPPSPPPPREYRPLPSTTARTPHLPPRAPPHPAPHHPARATGRGRAPPAHGRVNGPRNSLALVAAPVLLTFMGDARVLVSRQGVKLPLALVSNETTKQVQAGDEPTLLSLLGLDVELLMMRGRLCANAGSSVAQRASISTNETRKPDLLLCMLRGGRVPACASRRSIRARRAPAKIAACSSSLVCRRLQVSSRHRSTPIHPIKIRGEAYPALHSVAALTPQAAHRDLRTKALTLQGTQAALARFEAPTT